MKIRIKSLNGFPGETYSGTPLEIVMRMQKACQKPHASPNSFMAAFRKAAEQAGHSFRITRGADLKKRCRYFASSILLSGLGTLIVSPRNREYI
ncbi:MAG: hypothetical protein A3H69_03460 [Candidatus Sungbacteria bacterium RIFCSPLOWO2_02_FULL_47_9]|uniref:Uncharacterized protein n=1 Tax=Candidatus Sungbacteria bacterium RIFCSPHIGHO2_01_FULL_47_32 TaxID=1802264 RepID=A0A1G2K5B4_9BACT|nr:MAG: hypothetical protein A2633_04715 [Candidatus Sungbacteria bacterium RIFCSPHIGHO2_01_FULL_47_32]OHA05469.1 MAG: hypothetical protein A3A28_03175 [Candidatus Sungbacteria bacterium RIFCSPLOWO2_01_FULL_47_32]OHA11581.1 MAG: hypothetical protein A3H69_03460 [Candidatus Sungbacteria bacterium RIFCSPLOWO2_02_FULL_47_9]